MVATETDFTLAEALEAARRPVEPCPMPPVSDWRTRVATSARVRRLLPSAVMVRRAEAGGRALWSSDPAERERARRAMNALVGGTERAHEAELLARQHLIEKKVKETLFWQPWTVPSLDRTSALRLRMTLRSARGIIVSPCHMGPYLLGVSAIASAGRVPYSATAWALDTPMPGYWGRRIARRREGARERGERLIRAAGSYAVLRALLEEREVVSVFFAMPGGHETRFLGKRVMMASGTARLAAETDAVVLPIRTRRQGHRVWVDVASTLDSRDFDSYEDLHAALAAVHERWILELPASMEDPNRGGAWEQSATAQAWLRPPRRTVTPARSA